MIRLRYKPVVCTHFDPLDPYDLHSNLSWNNSTKISGAKYGGYCHNRGAVRAYSLQIRNLNFKNQFTVSIWLYQDYQDHWTINDRYVQRDWGNLVGGVDSANMLFGFGWVWYDGSIDNNARLYWDNNTNIGLYQQPNYRSYDKRWVHLEYARGTNNHYYIFLDGKLMTDFNNSRFCNTNPGNNIVRFNTCAKYIGEVMATQHCLHTTNFTPYQQPFYYLPSRNRIIQEKDNTSIYGKTIDADEKIII